MSQANRSANRTIRQPLRAARAGLALALAALGFSAPGCDWIHFAFMNSIPFSANLERNPEVHVYLAIDGLSYRTAKEVKDSGLLPPDWRLSKFVTGFPGTSDASWTRILHTEKLGGYEMEYYHPERDEIVNKGILGLAKHITPPLFEFMNFEFEYLKAFDDQGSGYFHSVNAYRDTYVSKADTIDNFFYLLDGRVKTSKVFSSYILEMDVLGHMQSAQEATRGFYALAKRLEQFRRSHSDQRIHFTVLSDHGMDNIRIQQGRFMEMKNEFPKVGIELVDSLRGRDPERELYAIPIEHTRVTYLALHTHPDLVPEISRRMSTLESVDLAVGKAAPPASAQDAAADLSWYGIWADGKLAFRFGFDSKADRYYVPSGQDFARVDVPLEDARDFTDEHGASIPYKTMTDEQAFALTKHRRYPDLLYRVRTSLAPVGLEYPADVMISFRPGFAAMGFKPPGGDDIASAGFHGSLEELGTLGTLLTTERDLPDAVRADNFIEMFPWMKDHIRARGGHFVEGDPNASLSD